MFCKNCGKELSDTAKFCGTCGTPVAPPAPEVPVNEEVCAEPVAAPAPEAEPIYNATPVAEPTYYTAPATEEIGATTVLTEDPFASEQQYNYYQSAPVYPEPKVGKGKFVKTKSSAGIKRVSLAAKVVGLVCLALCVAMGALSVSISIADLPVWEYAGVDTSDIDDVTDPLEKLLDDPQTEKELKDHDDVVETIEKVIDTPSLINIYLMGHVTEEVADDLGEDTEDFEDALDALFIMLAVVAGYTLFVMLITLLGMMLRNNVFTVIALLLGAGFAALFSGLIYTVFMVVAYIVLFCLQFTVNKSYKAYRRA